MKSTKNQIKNRTTNWKEILPLVFSIFSFITSIISIGLSYNAQRLVQAETKRQYQALVKPYYYLARSTDLKTEYDAQSMRNYCSHVVLLNTNYRREISAVKLNNSSRYLFLTFINHGPGTIKDFYFPQFTWQPKDQGVAPNILAGAKSVFNILKNGDCLAVLVDVIDSYDETKSLEEQVSRNFMDINYTISYVDLLGQTYEQSHNMLEGPAIQLTK